MIWQLNEADTRVKTLKREFVPPIAMNTNSFPEIVNFLGVLAVVSGIPYSFTRCGPLIMGYVCTCRSDPDIAVLTPSNQDKGWHPTFFLQQLVGIFVT
jgi:hypothetical protein